MNPYEFIASGCELVQTDGAWIAKWKANVYTGQTYNVLGSELDSDTLIFKIAVVGPENSPIIESDGNTAPYERGKEDAVELVLFHNGKKEGKVSVYYG